MFVAGYVFQVQSPNGLQHSAPPPLPEKQAFECAQHVCDDGDVVDAVVEVVVVTIGACALL